MKKCKEGHPPYIEGNGCPECRKVNSRKFHEARSQSAEWIQHHTEYNKQWYKTHGSSPQYRLSQRANRLKNLYWPTMTGLQALAEYERLLAVQNYCCFICEVHQEEYEGPFHVDHCHETGRVRGLLCAVCNKYVVGGIDLRAKAKKVHITKAAMIQNLVKYLSVEE